MGAFSGGFCTPRRDDGLDGLCVVQVSEWYVRKSGKIHMFRSIDGQPRSVHPIASWPENDCPVFFAKSAWQPLTPEVAREILGAKPERPHH